MTFTVYNITLERLPAGIMRDLDGGVTLLKPPFNEPPPEVWRPDRVERDSSDSDGFGLLMVDLGGPTTQRRRKECTAVVEEVREAGEHIGVLGFARTVWRFPRSTSAAEAFNHNKRCKASNVVYALFHIYRGITSLRDKKKISSEEPINVAAFVSGLNPQLYRQADQIRDTVQRMEGAKIYVIAYDTEKELACDAPVQRKGLAASFGENYVIAPSNLLAAEICRHIVRS